MGLITGPRDMAGCWKRAAPRGPGWKKPQHWGGQSAEDGESREGQAGAASGKCQGRWSRGTRTGRPSGSGL